MASILSDILVCPVCKRSLFTSLSDRKEIVCPTCRLAYEVRNDIPVMLRSLARELSEEEARSYRDAAAKVKPADL